MSSKAFNEAVALVNKKTLPDDIIQQLDHLRFNIDPLENERFGWLYEGLYVDTDGRPPTVDEEEL